MLSLLVLITVVGFAAVTWQWLAAESARSESQTNFENSEKHRLHSEANFAKALEAVDRMLTRVGEEELKDMPKMEQVRRSLLETKSHP